MTIALLPNTTATVLVMWSPDDWHNPTVWTAHRYPIIGWSVEHDYPEHDITSAIPITCESFDLATLNPWCIEYRSADGATWIFPEVSAYEDWGSAQAHAEDEGRQALARRAELRALRKPTAR
jgi:hypothetical protein